MTQMRPFQRISFSTPLVYEGRTKNRRKPLLSRDLALHGGMEGPSTLHRMWWWRWCCHSRRVQRFTTPWTLAHQAPFSMGFSRQGYWSGLPCPPPGDLPNPGIKLISPVSPSAKNPLQTGSSPLEPSSTCRMTPSHIPLHPTSFLLLKIGPR